MTLLQKAAAIAGIVMASVGVPATAYNLFKPTLPTSQQNGSGNVQAAGQGNLVTHGHNNTVNYINGNGNIVGSNAAEIAEQLIKKQREQHPDAAFHGTLRALGPAIQSTEQGAAQGDRRMQRALELVKENNIEEALPLFTENANDKEARWAQAAHQDEKTREETAIAYRNLGVFASLADPKLALWAYEKALDADSDDLVSLVGSGMILQISHSNLDKARTRLERALKVAKKDDEADYILCAQLCLGDIGKQQGEFSHALKYYLDGQATAGDRLAKPGTGNAKWKFYHGTSNESIGDLQMEKEDYPAARKSYQARHETISSLAASDKHNPVWQRDLSISHQKIGDVQKVQGDLNGAMESYGKSRDIIEPLAKTAPGNWGWQRDLAVSYEKIGRVFEAKGEHEAALKYFGDSRDIILRLLAKSDPDNRGWQRDLSVSYDEIGGALEAKGDLEGALKTYQDRLHVAKGLALSDPGIARWQLDLAVSLSKIAHVHQRYGDKKKEQDYSRQAKAIRARLTKFSPDTAHWKQDLDQFDRDMTVLAKR